MKTSVINKLLLAIAVVFFAQLLIRSCVAHRAAPVEGSDAYYYSLTSQEHPDWTSDMVEDYVFLSQDSFSIKYPNAE